MLDPPSGSGATLVGAFYYSQDGHADCRWVGEPAKL
jgi:hypothetical protein